jgi:hypothetical protein
LTMSRHNPCCWGRNRAWENHQCRCRALDHHTSVCPSRSSRISCC